MLTIAVLWYDKTAPESTPASRHAPARSNRQTEIRVNNLERRVRAHIIHRLRDNYSAPDADDIAVALGVSPDMVVAALRALADAHRLALLPGSDRVWMIHPFRGGDGFRRPRRRAWRWYANCVWDGL